MYGLRCTVVRGSHHGAWLGCVQCRVPLRHASAALTRAGTLLRRQPMSHVHPVRIAGTLFAIAFTLTLSAAGTVPAAAAGTGKPSTPVAAPGGAGARSLPAGATACRS